MSELKPCPMCGNKQPQIDCFGVTIRASCYDCGIQTPNYHIDDVERDYVVDNWNQRVGTEENQRLTDIATKHAVVNDERYELLEKQKSDIEKMLEQLFKHEKVDAWLACKMNDMLDDVNHQLAKSQIGAVSNSNDD